MGRRSCLLSSHWWPCLIRTTSPDRHPFRTCIRSTPGLVFPPFCCSRCNTCSDSCPICFREFGSNCAPPICRCTFSSELLDS
uniref:Putative secreted protein n=1 Tax=Anopheles darlingi TaxID=43151 RepID=A0A2M4DRD1_ANODA